MFLFGCGLFNFFGIFDDLITVLITWLHVLNTVTLRLEELKENTSIQ